MGTIDGVNCIGHGQFLTVPENNENISGLTIRYTGNELPQECFAGIVSVVQSGFQFITGSGNNQYNQINKIDHKASVDELKYLYEDQEVHSHDSDFHDNKYKQDYNEAFEVIKKSIDLGEITLQ